MKLFAFAKAALLHPRSVGAFVPSSHRLADCMAHCIDITQPGNVLELGPGTGVITKAILDCGISNNKLIALELSPSFATQLRTHFPKITVIQGNAIYLSDLLKDKKPIHTIISGLPLRNFSKQNREKILSEIPKILAPGGQFIQFSYAIKNNPDFYPHDMILINSFMVWRNFPPARVSVFRKR